MESVISRTLKAKGNSPSCPSPSPSTPIATPWYTNCVLTPVPRALPLHYNFVISKDPAVLSIWPEVPEN